MGDKAKINGLAIVIGALVGVSCISTLSVSIQNGDLKNQVSELRRDIRDLENSMQDMLTQQKGDIQEILAQEQSLFSTTSVELKTKNKKFEVTMQGIPKAIDKGEKLIVKIIANGKTYEQEANADYKAVLEVELTDRIQPIFIIQSDKGVKQEVLETQYTSDMFQDEVSAEWVDDSEDVSKVRLNALIEGELKASDIESAAFIIEDTDIVLEENQAYSSNVEYAGERPFPTKEKKGIIVPAQRVTSQYRPEALAYGSDFTQYMLEEDGILYNVYLVITTKDGMKYTSSDNPIATFSCQAGSRNYDISYERLMPIINSIYE